MNDDRHAPPHNAFEADQAGTPERTAAEGRIEGLRLEGGVFVEAVRATRMPMAVTAPSLPGNPIVFANDAFLRLSGYSMDEVLGQQPHFLNGAGTDPEDAVTFREALAHARDANIETVQYRKDGSRFLASVFLSAFKDEGGRTVHQFLSYLDVTARETAEDRLAKARVAEERQAFLLQLSDALRAEPDADAVAHRAITMLSEAMQLDRCYITTYRVAEDRADFPTRSATTGFRLFPNPCACRTSPRPSSKCGSRPSWSTTTSSGEGSPTRSGGIAKSSACARCSPRRSAAARAARSAR